MATHRKYSKKKPLKAPLNTRKIRRKKSAVLKAQSTMTVHHRRPVSLGGSTNDANVSYISEEVHKAWTIVVGNMNPEQICNHINTYFKPKGLTVVCHFINGRRCTKMGHSSASFAVMSYAWKILFGKETQFRKKIELINNRLLDPSYHFYVRE